MVQTDQCGCSEIRNLELVPSYGLKTTTRYIALQNEKHILFISRLTLRVSETLQFPYGQLPLVTNVSNAVLEYCIINTNGPTDYTIERNTKTVSQQA